MFIIYLLLSWFIHLTPNPIKSKTIRIRSPRMRKICEDGTGTSGIARDEVVVVLGVRVVVVVVDDVGNIEDFRVLTDVGSTVVFDM